jgi:hypothetical protein
MIESGNTLSWGVYDMLDLPEPAPMRSCPINALRMDSWPTNKQFITKSWVGIEFSLKTSLDAGKAALDSTAGYIEGM